MKINLNTFVISDWHFGHRNIMQFVDRPENHEELIIERCNEFVHKHDQLLFLGDLTFFNKEKSKAWFDQLKCKNRFMVRGNHDGKSETFYRDIGFLTVPPIFKRFKNKYDLSIYTLLTHEPVTELPENWVNIHGHIHTGQHREYDLTDNHYNVSCEPLEFWPITIGNILKGVVCSE